MDTLEQAAEDLNITASFANTRYVDSKDWPHVETHATLARNGQPFWSGKYSQGTACLAPSIQRDLPRGGGVTLDVLEKRKCLAGYKAPKVADILHSLFMDGAADFDALSFEEWASELGFDPDSRKAEASYRECVATGQKLRRTFDADTLAKLRELAGEY